MTGQYSRQEKVRFRRNSFTEKPSLLPPFIINKTFPLLLPGRSFAGVVAGGFFPKFDRAVN